MALKFLSRLADLLLTTDLDTALRLMPDVPSGGGSFSGLGLWRYRTETTSTPSTGRLQFDNLTIDSATELYIHKVNDTGTDVSAFLNTIGVGSIVYVQQQGDATQFATAIIGTPVLNGDVYTLPLTTVEGQGTAPSNNTQVAVVIGNSVGGGGVTDHGALTGLADDDHLQYLHKDITRSITVGYTTDTEADSFSSSVTPDFSLEYLKTMTVTSDFTLFVPSGGNGHGEYYLTVTGTGPYTMTPVANMVMLDANLPLVVGENYLLNIRRFSATNAVAQLIQLPTRVSTDITATVGALTLAPVDATIS
jgi:hypothetical protein